MGAAIVLGLLADFGVVQGARAAEAVQLNVSLYKVIPEYDSFEATVRQCWQEKHPEVELVFSDWNCYDPEVPDDLDVFVFDTTSLDTFAGKGYLLALSEEQIEDYDDLIPGFMEGCRVDGTICVVPQLLCADILYTRKGDTALKDVQSIDDLYDILGGDGLLTDKSSKIILICTYLQALIDETRGSVDAFPLVEEDSLSSGAVGSLEKMRDMRQIDPEAAPHSSDRFYYARKFAEGMGRAYIGYTEAMDVMGEAASDMDLRLFSMKGETDIPVFYADVVAVNAKIGDEKKALALELLNMLTGKELLLRVSDHEADPRYLLPARNSVYDALAETYPLYGKLKQIATVSDARVFRIQPDGVAYMEAAEAHAGILPSFYK